jgi:hypothetical protein
LADNGENEERKAQKQRKKDQSTMLEPAPAARLDPIQDPVGHDIEDNGNRCKIE